MKPTAFISQARRSLWLPPLLGGLALLAIHGIARAAAARSEGALAASDVGALSFLPTLLWGAGLTALFAAVVPTWRKLLGTAYHATAFLLVVGAFKEAALGVGPVFSDLYFLLQNPVDNPSALAVMDFLVPAFVGTQVIAALLLKALNRLEARTEPRLAVAGGLLLATGALALVPTGHLLGSLIRSSPLSNAKARVLPLTPQVSREQVSELVNAMTGHPANPSGVAFCSEAPSAHVAPSGPALDGAVVIIAEGLGTEAVRRRAKGKRVMPFLSDLLDTEPSTGTFALDSFLAVGAKTSRAFPALLAGVPITPNARLLHLRPLPTFEPTLAALADGKREVRARLAADPAFEQLDQALLQLGAQVVEGRKPDDVVAPLAWGIDDRTLLLRSRADLERLVADGHRSHPERGVLYVINTIGTHHPYAIPAGRKRRFPGERAIDKENETLALLDESLSDFISWFKRTPALNNTALFILGDHVSHLTNASARRLGGPTDYKTPLIGLNVPKAAATSLQSWRGHFTSQLDFAPTLAHLLAAPSPACAAGRDLLDTAPRTPRALFSFDDDTGQLTGFCDEDETRYLKQAGGLVAQPVRRERCALDLDRLAQTYVSLMPLLVQADAFAPPSVTQKPARTTAPIQTKETLVASHRGAVTGPPTKAQENRASSATAAFQAGFAWVEVDVTVTKDGELVVAHDTNVQQGDKTIPLSKLTLKTLKTLAPQTERFEDWLAQVPPSLNLIVEMKPAHTVELTLSLVHSLARLLRKESSHRKLLTDSFSLTAVLAMKRVATWEVALDTPFKRPLTEQDVAYFSSLGLGWVFVHHSVATASLLKQLHAKGIKLMVYPVAERADLAPLAGAAPDGVIADTAKVLSFF